MSELKNIRLQMGYKQYELANMLNVSQGSISAWEIGSRTPSVKKMQQIEDLTNVPKEKIFSSAFDYKM